MSEKLKDIMEGVESKDPFIVINEMGIGFKPTLIPGHFFAISVNLPFEVNENVLPLNKYTYEAEKDDRFFISKEPYFDEMPIGLALRIDNPDYVMMLNLKVIPPVYRYKILEVYYQAFKNAIHVGYKEDLSEETMTVLERLKENNYIAPFLSVTKSMMESLTGINLDFAINRYRTVTLQNVKLLDWNSLPDLAMMGVSERGMTFNSGAGGLEGMFNTFVSRL